MVYEALEVLSDPEARKRYDMSRELGHKKYQGSAKMSAKARKTHETTHQTSHPKEAKRRKSSPKMPKSGKNNQEFRLLMKIYEVLKRLPRESRQEILSKDFSQQQRLRLEQWMVDHATQPLTVAIQPSFHNSSGTQDVSYQGLPVTCRTAAIPKVKSKRKAPQRTGHLKGMRRVSKKPERYVASVQFDALEIQSGFSDLPTALECVVILTSAKQKMCACGNSDFESFLEEALISSAKEQERNLEELNIYFAVKQKAAFFIGDSIVPTPRVRSVREAVRIQKSLLPFRGKKPGRGSYFFLCSLTEMEDTWKGLQQAVVDAWESLGVDSTHYIQRLRDLYEANAAFRARHLRIWERKNMGMEDKGTRLCPRPRRSLKQTPRTEAMKIQKLLSNWKTMLEKEAQRASSTRRIDLQRKRRLEELKRRRLRKEECLRREALRQRMKADLTMDEILRGTTFSQQKWCRDESGVMVWCQGYLACLVSESGGINFASNKFLRFFNLAMPVLSRKKNLQGQ